ncbi:MAG TPA: FtsH protease activity modulator HflK [Rhodanobacteraceae bacterium]|nr:FtsH protease activity modulator HflK [Rhodanobacteraceae bacterium]
MAWNEPGGGQRDPWGGKDKGPDLDAVLKRLRARFGRFGSGGGLPLTILIILLVLWLIFDSIVVVDARQVGVVLRFGQYERMLQPGFHVKLPRPVEDVYKVATTQVRSVSDQMRMITGDENIVQVNFNIQYQVKDARKFLFSMKDPDGTLHEAAEAAVRSVVGSSSMDTILSGHGAQLVTETRQLLQQTLDGYESGIMVTDVSFQNVAPPQEVKAAFDDVNKAREDKQRIENEARAYASKVVPVARGAAARIAAQAQGYKAQRIAIAKGDTARFNLVLAQYRAAPDVTRERLWLETMEDVLANNRKVIDGSGGKNLLYLPALGTQGATTVPKAGAAAASAANASTPSGSDSDGSGSMQ